MIRNPQRSDRPHAEYSPSRRRLLEGISIGVGAIVGVALGYPVIGFLLAPLAEKTPQVWRAVGRVKDFHVGQTVEVTFENASPLPWAGATAKTAAWLRRANAQDFIAFSINCTHLNCPVRWEASSTLFFCPCHGGVYYQDGSVAAGPPPNPLPRYPVRILDGQVEIRTSPLPTTTTTSQIGGSG
ncbi:MAG TPA: Rieske 2Fe-2S domain-containing protein [Chloroflexota bacterium]|nr:Rieske 2Fe-2S domain-containing protein [Chloroflexota bacterium]